MAEALVMERLLDLHCRFLSLSVLQNAGFFYWEDCKPFFKSKCGCRCGGWTCKNFTDFNVIGASAVLSYPITADHDVFMPGSPGATNSMSSCRNSEINPDFLSER
ncbi:protein of unknown function (DUF4495) [Popillia japonica]|uniref:Post-SET domain-containing protein n=1 Tax=Popillia japonica TaxID=7064 RepID=A0AAW1JWG3_POPJA